MSSKFFDGYIEDQFLFLVISLEPWGFFRGFTIPDELTIGTNMLGYKKKQGDIEVLLLGDKYSGLVKENNFNFLVIPPPVKDLDFDEKRFLPFGYLRIHLEEESTAIVETDPLGIHPAFYSFFGDDLIFTVRKKWLKDITNKIFELPNNAIVEFSYRSVNIKNNPIPEEADVNSLEKIHELISYVLKTQEKKPIYIFRGSKFDKKILELFSSLDSGSKIEFVPVDRQSKEALSKHIKALGLDNIEIKILFNLEENLCRDEVVCIKEVLAQLQNKAVKEKRYDDKLIMFHLLASKDLIDFSESNDNIIQFVKKRELYKYFRSYFATSWPLCVIDPFLYSENMYTKGKKMMKEIVS